MLDFTLSRMYDWSFNKYKAQKVCQQFFSYSGTNDPDAHSSELANKEV